MALCFMRASASIGMFLYTAYLCSHRKGMRLHFSPDVPPAAAPVALTPSSVSKVQQTSLIMTATCHLQACVVLHIPCWKASPFIWTLRR